MAKRPRKRNRHYQRRIVLFVDFLGFKEHVARTESDHEHLQCLIRSMDAIGEIGGDIAEFHSSQKVTQFSDNVVVSYKVTEPSAVFDLLNEIAFVTIDLVERGFLLRGGVTVGDLLHTRKHIVGPAMVEAARLEQAVAGAPRIIIDPSVLDVARQATREGHGEEEEADYARAFMTQDDDGLHYFDYVSWQSVVAVTGGDNDLYPGYMQKLGRLLEAGLGHAHPRVVEKYLWLFEKYAKALSEFDAIPLDHPYRAANPEVCDDMESLPRFHDLATEARATVEAAKRKSSRSS